MRLKNWKIGLFLVLALVATSSAWSDGKKTEEIDSLIARFVELRQFNGTVLVAEGGKIVHQGGYGLAHMEWDLPNTPETKFRLGSITKQFTSMLILQLVEETKFGLNDSLFELLPYYREDTGSKITLHQLLNHTSGIPSYTGLPGFMADDSRDPYDPETFVREFCSGDLEFEPGSEFSYNNSGYFLLGAILEHATGKTYTELLGEKILDPIGMDATGYDVSAEILDHRAAGYEKTANGFRNADYLDMTIPYAAGSLYSTVGDLYLWDRALHKGKLLGKELTERMFTPGMANYAYGWIVSERPIGPDGEARTVIGHGGGINGFNTLIERVVDDEHLVVLLNNTGRAPLGPMSAGIVDILHGRSPEMPQKALAESGETEAAIKSYARSLQLDPTNRNAVEKLTELTAPRE